MDEFPNIYLFTLFTKNWTYVLMGVTLLCLWGFWHFLTARDKKTGKDPNKL